MVSELLTDPDAFMRRQSAEPSFGGPVLVVLFAGLASVLSVVIVFQEIASGFEGDLGTVAAIGSVTGAVAGLLAVFVLWAIYAVAFHVISLAFDGEGGFRTTLSLVGWGFLPSIFSGVVAAVAMYLAIQGISVPSDPAAAATFQQQLQDQPVMLAASAAGIVFTLWQAFIWTFAVKHARSLEVRQAALTVAGPVALSIVWTLYNLL